ncbi:unnamed protein product, partial [Phaeothamnion confervicola]
PPQANSAIYSASIVERATERWSRLENDAAPPDSWKMTVTCGRTPVVEVAGHVGVAVAGQHRPRSRRAAAVDDAEAASPDNVAQAALRRRHVHRRCQQSFDEAPLPLGAIPRRSLQRPRPAPWSVPAHSGPPASSPALPPSAQRGFSSCAVNCYSSGSTASSCSSAVARSIDRLHLFPETACTCSPRPPDQ